MLERNVLQDLAAARKVLAISEETNISLSSKARARARRASPVALRPPACANVWRRPACSCSSWRVPTECSRCAWARVGKPQLVTCVVLVERRRRTLKRRGDGSSAAWGTTCVRARACARPWQTMEVAVWHCGAVGDRDTTAVCEDLEQQIVDLDTNIHK